MTTAPPPDAPVDAVVFELAALLDTSGPGAVPRRGARRLVAALAAHGVPAHVRQAGGTGEAAGTVALAAQLGETGLAPHAQLLAEGRDPEGRVLSVLAAPPAPGRTPIAPAAPVVTIGDEEHVHQAVLGALAGEVGAFAGASLLVAPPDADSVAAARDRHLALTKPPGSLGRLEDVGCQLAGIAAAVPPPVPGPAAVAVFAGDHGVHAQGVTPWPQEVTAQMVANFARGGAAINVLAGHAGAQVVVVDVGVAADLPAELDASPVIRRRRVRAGTADLSTGPAMSPAEAREALDVGAETAARLVADGARCLVTGDMGIANTTPSAALVAALAGRPAEGVTGRGTGIDDATLDRKAAIVAAAAARAHAEHGDDALAVLAEVGGLEHAALAGFIIGGAALQVPVVIDGVIAAAALLVAARLVPGVEACVIAGHRSVEPGASAVLEELGLAPMVDLGLRLGEGTGAALALPLVESAALVLRDMATFDEAGVTDKAD
jgi:nicotinate-nucleotide--dimethylbenzimidazole phosphoribosyltransferase